MYKFIGHHLPNTIMAELCQQIYIRFKILNIKHTYTYTYVCIKYANKFRIRSKSKIAN